jgi:hypothetical protein
MPGPKLTVVDNRGVKFINDHLKVWFNLVPDPENDGKNWYAGSATSALLDNREILDPVKADCLWLYMCHDREKRCMQIDQIQLCESPNSKELGDPARLSDKEYQLIDQSVRVEPEFVEITVASSPFQCTYPVGGEMAQLTCELRRVIGLKAEASCVYEKLSIHVEPGAEPEPCFAVRYYAHLNTGWGGLTGYGRAQAFVAGTDWGARSAYAFGCNACIDELKLDSSNVWALVSPCKSLRCWHVFSREADFRTVLDAASHKT